MKVLVAISMIVAAPFVFAAENSVMPAMMAASAVSVAPPNLTVKGKVLEVKDVESYTYLRLKTKEGETWAAVNKSKVKMGASVSIENAVVMKNFESKTLKKTFPSIVFGALSGAVADVGNSTDVAHGAPGKKPVIGDVHVAKATGANAQTVEEVITKAAELKEKTVLVHAKVVKFNAQIMGKNWVHLSDGTGSAEKNTNDILVTTLDEAKVGDVVTVKGVVRADKDFGAGYAYKVLIEEGKLQK
jgi:hypothetical protein